MSKHVLVVDDNEDHAKTLAMIMRLRGYETDSFFDGESAIEAADQAIPDIMLLDIGLPAMSGHDVCRLIRKREWGERITLIAITGYGSSADRQKSLESGFNAHFTKPVDLPGLFMLLDHLS